jgi:hypothetical protein
VDVCCFKYSASIVDCCAPASGPASKFPDISELG